MKSSLSILFLFTLTLFQACDTHFRSSSAGNDSTKGRLTTSSRRTDRGLWHIEYGHDGDTLAFAVISEPLPGSDTTYGHLTSNSEGLGGRGVSKPDGSGTLPMTYQLYQVTPNGVLFTDSRVSASTFKAFLDSSPPDYSIASLLEFAARPPTQTQ